ncbi:hypothetical protein [Streptococcus suis]|uniref:hypothetical protein n=1 Tax=Streptococcus suis TaxID=1307 RepID=UPI0005CE6BEC|nr:Uncharacterised protein [Streptococcus suis]
MTEKLQKTWVVDGYVWLHCPVCGRNVMLFDVCECNWENTGETNIDGGPNKMTLAEAKIAFAEGRPII